VGQYGLLASFFLIPLNFQVELNLLRDSDSLNEKERRKRSTGTSRIDDVIVRTELAAFELSWIVVYGGLKEPI